MAAISPVSLMRAVPLGAVERRGLGVGLGLAEQFLGVLALDVAPQVDVVARLALGSARRLEDADGQHMEQAAGVADRGRVAPVQQEPRLVGETVEAQCQGADAGRS